MDDLFDDISKYLPKYLSSDATVNLFEELKQFPANIDSRLYTDVLKDEANILQGDGLNPLWVSNLPDTQIKKARVMVLSNTCDITSQNSRLIGPRLLYCPIISFEGFASLVSKNTEIPADEYLRAIHDQRVTSMFFLPKNDRLGEDSIALLDRINNCDAQTMDVCELTKNRLFVLSDYGFYLFLFKLSIHLTRIREGVARN